MKYDVQHWGMSAAANRNQTCDRCKRILKPRSAKYPYKAVSMQENCIFFADQLSMEYSNYLFRPLRVQLCKDCASIFGEEYRLHMYDYHLVRNLYWFSDQRSTLVGTATYDAEQEDGVMMDGMQIKSHHRWLEEHERVAGLLASWWPELPALVAAHEAKTLEDEARWNADTAKRQKAQEDAYARLNEHEG